MEHHQKEEAPYLLDRLLGLMGDFHVDRVTGVGQRVAHWQQVQLQEYVY